MGVDAGRAKELFLNASDLANPAERAAYLERECGGDVELRHRVEALLSAHDGGGPSEEVDAGGMSGTTAPGTPEATAAVDAETLRASALRPGSSARTARAPRSRVSGGPTLPADWWQVR